MYKKSDGIELINIYKHYTLSTYLAIAPKRLKLTHIECIDTKTGLINQTGVISLVNEFISVYSHPVTPKIKSIYGIGYYNNYFELYDFIKKSKKNITLRSLEFLKEDGKRCFYYALKNLNESMHYKEGLLFTKILMIYKNTLTVQELLMWVEDIVATEAKERLQKDLITRRLVNKEIPKAHMIKLAEAAANVPVPKFQNQSLSSETKSVDPIVIKERNDARQKFNHMFEPYKNGIDLVLGYQDKGLFNKKTNCLNLNIHDQQEGTIIIGDDSGSKEILRSYMYQSVYNSSGLLLFSPLSDKATIHYVFQMAKHFDVLDNVHIFYFGSDRFNRCNINDYIRSNKIVLILYPDFSERLGNERLLIESYHSINNIIDTICTSNTNTTTAKFPFNIYLNDISFSDPVQIHITNILNKLLSLHQYNINYYIINENLSLLESSYYKIIFQKIKNVIILNNNSGQSICNIFDTKKIKPSDFSQLEPLAFYYFSYNVLANPNKFTGIYMPIDIEINLDEYLN